MTYRIRDHLSDVYLAPTFFSHDGRLKLHSA